MASERGTGQWSIGRKQNGLERPAIAGESPVDENALARWVEVLSTAGPEKPRGNPGRPLSKAKYYLMTDSAPVP